MNADRIAELLDQLKFDLEHGTQKRAWMAEYLLALLSEAEKQLKAEGTEAQREASAGNCATGGAGPAPSPGPTDSERRGVSTEKMTAKEALAEMDKWLAYGPPLTNSGWESYRAARSVLSALAKAGAK
jgi:hypothetical protein